MPSPDSPIRFLGTMLRSREITSWTNMGALAGCDARRRTHRMAIPCKRSATPQRACQGGQIVQVIVSRLLTLVLFCHAATAADLVVVAGAQSPLQHLSREQVADIYLGRVTTLPGGTSAQPLDLPASSQEREAFYSLITGKSSAQVRAYWAKMSFTGKGIPPKTVASSADIKKLASSKPGAIAYLAESAVDGSVKVLYSIK